MRLSTDSSQQPTWSAGRKAVGWSTETPGGDPSRWQPSARGIWGD